VKKKVKERRCTRCMFNLPLEDFAMNRTSIDGYTSWCKICHRDHKLELKAKKERRK